MFFSCCFFSLSLSLQFSSCNNHFVLDAYWCFEYNAIKERTKKNPKRQKSECGSKLKTNFLLLLRPLCFVLCLCQHSISESGDGFSCIFFPLNCSVCLILCFVCFFFCCHFDFWYWWWKNLDFISLYLDIMQSGYPQQYWCVFCVCRFGSVFFSIFFAHEFTLNVQQTDQTKTCHKPNKHLAMGNFFLFDSFFFVDFLCAFISFI